jgi:Arc/MetJ-type ribon-helix-helix transcriptional regulator
MGGKKPAPTKVTTLRLPTDLAAELSVVARADGLSVSDVVRAAIRKHIATRRADGAFQARLKVEMEKDRELLERLAE